MAHDVQRGGGKDYSTAVARDVLIFSDQIGWVYGLDARTGKEIYEAFGMSEISTFIPSGPSTPVKADSPGRPQPGRVVAALPPENQSQHRDRDLNSSDRH